MEDSYELIERVLDGEDPEDVIDSLDEDLFIEDLLSVEYFNPYTEEWETIDEIDEDLLDEIGDWDYREAELTEDEFYEKAQAVKDTLRRIGAGIATWAPRAALGAVTAYGAYHGHKHLMTSPTKLGRFYRKHGGTTLQRRLERLQSTARAMRRAYKAYGPVSKRHYKALLRQQKREQKYGKLKLPIGPWKSKKSARGRAHRR